MHTSRRRRAGDARGRAGRRRDRRERPAHRRLPVARPRRAERQHHRLRRADHPPADRDRGQLPEREVASCRTGAGDADPAGPAARGGRGRSADAEAADARRSQVRTVDRSERIRTYNYPENRISDHRTGYKAYNLDQVLDGDLEPVIDVAASRPTWPRGSRRSSDVTGVPPPAAPSTAAARLADGRRGQPGVRRRPSCSRTCSASTAEPAAAGRRPSSRRPRAAYDGAGRATRRPGAAAAPDRAPRPSGTSSWRSGPGSSCPARRPSCSPGWAIERAARRRRGRRAGPVVVDLCTGSGAIALGRGRPRCPGAGARGRARRGRAYAWAERNLAGHRRRPAAGRHGRRVPRPRRHRRRGGVQPAVHPARGLRVRGRRGPRPRPGAGAVLRRRRARRDAGRSSASRPGCCGPAGWSAPSTPTSRASPRRRSSPATGRWADVRDHHDLAGRPRFVDRPAGTMTACD